MRSSSSFSERKLVMRKSAWKRRGTSTTFNERSERRGARDLQITHGLKQPEWVYEERPELNGTSILDTLKELKRQVV